MSHPFPNLVVTKLALQNLPPQGWLLDLGCHQGQTARIIKKGCPGCQYWGLDFDPKALKIACRYLDQAILADLESTNLKLPKKKFDLIIASNLLEHLKNPLATLKKILPSLKKNGFLIIAVPNLAHWSVRFQLLLGRFPRHPHTILDPDHLRFFTRQSLETMIAKTSLHLVTQKTNYLGWRAVIASLAPGLFASQFISLCQKNSPKK